MRRLTLSFLFALSLQLCWVNEPIAYADPVSGVSGVYAVERRLYQQVAGLGTATLDYTVPNGATLILENIGGTGPGVSVTVNSRFQLIWDPSGANTTVVSGYSDTSQPSIKEFLGDGSKVMRISLVNGSSSAYFLGGFWVGRVVQ